MYRVYSNCNTITATGRVIMNEPNIQLIPKDFVVELPSDSQKMEIRKTRNTKDRDDFAIAYCPNVVIDGPSDSLISLRSAFIPFKG